ncbi:transposase [Stenotrophomonas sp. YIM B13575]|jgi:transposase|nr:transposase [Stenotrophomonas sp. PA-6-5C]HED4878543.1 transposase [Stenotrophomonas maltophilia]
MAKQITQGMRDEAVRLVVVEGQTVRDVCQLMDVGPTALRRWIEQWRRKHDPHAEAPPVDAQVRIAELEAQNRRLKEERDLLKKSIAFFIRDSDHRNK